MIAQAPFEIQTLIDLICFPQRILEIGVWHGGTLERWVELADTVVGVDLDTSEIELADGVVLIEGSSQDPAVVAAVAEFAPFDFAFIDADHTYQSVRADWDNYRPLVNGIVAFHDINPRPGYGVSELWGQIRLEPGARTVEIRQRFPYEAPGLSEGYEPGIGVVWV